MPATLATEGLPTRFGDFELEAELARGGMGVVYRARHVSLNRRVALKMILAGPFAAPAAAQRFRIEAEAAAGLDHPHIVPIYEIGTCEGKTYFTMKLVEGETLAARLRALTVEQRTGETLRSLIRILLQVVQAVDFAHQRGVIHRDLKPANILLEGDSQTPYVADFGLAKRTPIGLGETATAEDLTATGAILGTPNYMAPEQASGTGTTTTQTDVYALGAILYEILTGRPPLVGGSPVATLLKVQQEDPLPPSQVRPGVDTGLAAVALRCLHKEPGERYPNATALAADLRAWLAGEPLSVRPPRLVQIVRHWLNHHLRDAFWIGIVGVLGGGLGVSLSTFAWIGGLFRSAQTVLDRFPSVEAPTWLRLLAMPAELDAASAVWPQMLGAIVLSCLGLFLGWFVDLTHVQRALRHGLGLGLITGLVVALAVVPVFVLYGVVGIDLKLEFELVEGYFERFGNDAENKQVPLKRLDLFTVHPELREFQGKEAANQYFALRNVVKVVRIFEGAWAALLLAIVVFPFLCVGQCLLAGLVFRRCDGKLRRALLYAIVVLPCAHLLIYGAYFVMSGIYGGFGSGPADGPPPVSPLGFGLRCLFNVGLVALMIRTIRPPGALMPMLVLLALWISAGLFIDRYFVGDDRLVFWNLPALPLPYLVKHQAVLFGGLALVCLFLYWLLQRSLAKRPTPPNSCSP